MACDPPVQNCKSRRCAQAGVCNCLIVYSDGSQVPGSGTGDDPYVIEKAPIKAIRDSAGNLLTPDSNRIVQLPTYIQKIISAETGIEYIPDSTGRVVLPVSAISTLSFRDVQGNILSVGSDDVITIEMDGDEGVMVGQTSPVVDQIQKKITFPGFKVFEYSVKNRLLSFPGSNGLTSFSTGLLDFVGPNPTTVGNNNVYYTLAISLQLFFGDNPYTTPNQDFFKFNLHVDYNSLSSYSWPIATECAFIGDKATSYNTYFFNVETPIDWTDDLTLRLELTEVQMDAYRKGRILANAQVMGYWV